MKYLENNYPVADRDKPYHFKFAQSNGVLHMSLATTQQEGWTVHPAQDQMKVRSLKDSVILMHNYSCHNLWWTSIIQDKHWGPLLACLYML